MPKHRVRDFNPFLVLAGGDITPPTDYGWINNLGNLIQNNSGNVFVFNPAPFTNYDLFDYAGDQVVDYNGDPVIFQQ